MKWLKNLIEKELGLKIIHKNINMRALTLKRKSLRL